MTKTTKDSFDKKSFREKDSDKKGKRAYRERKQQDKEAEELIQEWIKKGEFTKEGKLADRFTRVDGTDTI